MNLTLRREEIRDDGVFGILKDEFDDVLFFTLEHAYRYEDGEYYAKIPEGTYVCKRTHRTLVENPTEDDYFWTYEVTAVADHSGILFHVGNYNKDSNGCILLGLALGRMMRGGKMLTYSLQAFKKFMKLLDGIEEFTLTVEGK